MKTGERLSQWQGNAHSCQGPTLSGYIWEEKKKTNDARTQRRGTMLGNEVP